MVKIKHVHFANWAKVIEALADKGVSDESSARAFLANGENNDFYYSVCYIKDSQEIYTHGQFYKCTDDTELIESKADISHTHTYTDLLSGNDPDKVLVSTDDSFVLKDIEELMGVTNTSMQLKFYCIEPVTLTINSVSATYPSNSVVNVYFKDGDVFELATTSDSSIMTLDAWPGALGTFYSWLEGVQVFNNIIFDMNTEDMYTKWNQNNQGDYHVQKAQYSNCVFWSDNPYIHTLEQRTNYTLYNTWQLPMCYSSIPENTYKPFYLAYGAKSDPNWSNANYISSFSATTTATAPFSYYGMTNIGIFNMAINPITLPADCRGLMFYSPAIERIGVLDASNTTKFGAKQGSWREAFGYCSALKTLYITGLKASINISWSPIDVDSVEYIISNAANTSAITISVSPYTWYRLTDDIKTAASDKNISIALITTNYVEDSRMSDMLTKSAQTLSEDEILQVHENLDLTWTNYE